MALDSKFSKAAQSFSESVQFIIFLPSHLHPLIPNSFLLEPNTWPASNQNGIYIAPLIGYEDFIPDFGVFSNVSGKIAHSSFIAAINKLKLDKSAGFLTLPIHKKSFISAGSPFAGHTEYIGHL